MRFSHRRKTTRGWVSVYVCFDWECPDLDENTAGVWVPEERRIYLNVTYLNDAATTLAHEWQHVEGWAHGLPNTGERHESCIEATAQLIKRIPKVV